MSSSLQEEGSINMCIEIHLMLISKKMGYKGLTTAHGFRHLALTAGQEVLKVDHEIIQRQMAHSFGDKIRGYYDKSQMLTERKDSMIAWCDALVDKVLSHKKQQD